MKFIPIGLQCAVPDAIKKCNLREYSYPFDWLWTPSKTTYSILSILLEKGVDEACLFMTTGYSYYTYLGNERYKSIKAIESIDEKTVISKEQINATTGLGITHFEINEEYKIKLKRRLQRLFDDIHSGESLVFIYADSSDKDHEYTIDNVIYSIDPTEYLLRIYDLIYSVNKNIEILYFCWENRVTPLRSLGVNTKSEHQNITHVPFSEIRNWYIRDWNGVSILIQQYFEKNKDKYYLSI
jgi:hypothetical protein